MKYTLLYGEDQEHGSMGFRIEGSKEIAGAYNMATDGVLIAHDILEHRAIKKIGTIGDELMALGGVWYVRGQHGELRRDRFGSAYTPAQNIASDVCNMGRDIIAGWKKYNEKIPNVKINGHLYLEDFEDIINESRRMLKLELDGDIEYTTEQLEKYLQDALKFMIAGFNQVQKRFARYNNRFQANNIFWSIVEAVDTALKHAEHGQKLQMNVNFQTAETNIKDITYGDYAY